MLLMSLPKQENEQNHHPIKNNSDKKTTKGNIKSKSRLCWSQIPVLALRPMTIKFASDMAT